MGEHQTTTDTYFHWFGIARHTNTNTNTNTNYKSKLQLQIQTQKTWQTGQSATLRDGLVATFY